MNTRYLFSIACILLLIVGFIPSLAQDSDTELWTGAEIQYNLNSKLRFEVNQEARFFHQVQDYKLTLTELAIRYKIFPFLSTQVKYRYVFIPSKGDKGVLYTDILSGFKPVKLPLSFNYRLRYEHGNEFELTEVNDWIRNKIGIEFNVTKLVDPYIEYESFYRLNQKNEFRANRYIAGLSWDLPRGFSLTSFYMYEKEFNVKLPEKKKIIGLTVGYKIK